MTTFFWMFLTSSYWSLKLLVFTGWFLARVTAWLLWPGILIAGLGAMLGFGCRQAHAGWFGWLGNDTRKLEAANRAVHAAAEVVNESARLQADQNVAISEAITALSSERARLAGHLQHIGDLASRDSQWAAALTAFSPMLIVVAVLAVGALALWMAFREQAGDAELAEVLVESVTSEDSRLTLGLFDTITTPRPRVLLPGDTQRLSSATTPANEEGGLPF